MNIDWAQLRKCRVTPYWFLESQPRLSFRDRVRLLFGARLRVIFESPDGNCHAACNISALVGEAKEDA